MYYRTFRCRVNHVHSKLLGSARLTWNNSSMNDMTRPTKCGIKLFVHSQTPTVAPFKFFSCDQAALELVFSVCPSVCLSLCPSVRHTFLTMFPSSYHHEIFRSYYQWQKWRPCKRSRSEVKGQGHRGHNPTLPFPDCNSSLNSRMMMKWCI